MNNVYMQFQNDVVATANNMVVQEMCAQNGIDFNQKLAQAEYIQHQKVMAFQHQKMMNRAYADYYSRGQKTSFFGKLKDAFAGDDHVGLAFQQEMMMRQMAMQQPVQTIEPVQQEQVEQVADEEIPFEDDARITKLEQEVGSIKNDIGELKESMAQLLAAIKG